MARRNKSAARRSAAQSHDAMGGGAAQPPLPWSRWLPFCIAATVIYLLPLGRTPFANNPNELSRLVLVASLTHDGSVQVDNAMKVYGTSQDLSERDGKHYSDKAPGLSFFAAPLERLLRLLLPGHEKDARYAAYWPLRHLLTFVLVLVPGALLPFAVLRAYPGLCGAARPWIALLIAVTTPLLSYSSVFFGHVTGSALATAAYLLLMKPGRPDAIPSVRDAVIAGLLAGLATFTEYFTLIIGAAAGVGLLARRAPAKVVGAYIVAGAIGIAPLLLYHQAAFGSPFATGYQFKTDEQHQAFHAQGLFGVTLPTRERLWGVLGSARRGIVFYCPLLLLALPGILLTHRRNPRDVLPLVVATAGYVFAASGFVDWRGGWSAASRHLLAIVPLWWLPLSDALEWAMRRPTAAVVAAALAGVSLLQTFLTVAVCPYFPDTLAVPLVEVAWRGLLDGAPGPNLITELTGASQWVGVGLFGLALLGALLAALWAMAASHAVRAAAICAAPLCAALGLAAQSATAAPDSAATVFSRAFVVNRTGHRELAQRLFKKSKQLESQRAGRPAAPRRGAP